MVDKLVYSAFTLSIRPNHIVFCIKKWFYPMSIMLFVEFRLAKLFVMTNATTSESDAVHSHVKVCLSLTALFFMVLKSRVLYS